MRIAPSRSSAFTTIHLARKKQTHGQDARERPAKNTGIAALCHALGRERPTSSKEIGQIPQSFGER
jgi:hypothetical protein